MKKLIKVILVLMGTFVIAGCSNDDGKQASDSISQTTEMTTVSSEKEEQKATVLLNEDGKKISSKEVVFQAGDTLYDVMDKNFDLEDDKGFITSIDGHKQDEEDDKYWTYTIDDKEVLKGATEVELKGGEKIDFDLSKME